MLPTTFEVDQYYSNEEIHRALNVGNVGGVRPCIEDNGQIRRLVIATAVDTARQSSENPYQDKIESDILVYTGTGLEGGQVLAGVNKRISQQAEMIFPIYGFILTTSRRDRSVGPKRWKFIGLLEFIRYYPEFQADVRGQTRQVWLFEFRIHRVPAIVPIDYDVEIAIDIIDRSRMASQIETSDREVVPLQDAKEAARQTEEMRGRLLGIMPQRFEAIVRDVLVRSGFERVSVTKYSQDGGIDVNAFAGAQMWPIAGMLLQVQAKRWLHTVGRKEVAELRGSLQPYARGAVITTSHFSRSAVNEAGDRGKNPIVLVDGYQFASLVLDYQISLE